MKSYQTASGYAIPNGTSASYYYQVKDWLGSTRITIRQNGVVDNSVDYYSYGKMMPARNTFATNQEGYRYQFTGHEKDGETSYQYHGARYYDEDLARYMSVDPLAMQFHSWSPYNYVMGNPIRLIDPTGKGPTDWVSINGQVLYDSKVTDQKTATDRYGDGAVYAAPGRKYETNEGAKIVLGQNGKYTKDGETFEVADMGNQSQTDLNWSLSSSVGLKGSSKNWLSGMNLDFFKDGLTTTNPSERFFNPAWRTPAMIAGYKGTENLANLFAGTTTTIVMLPLALEYGSVTLAQLGGEYGSATQIGAWYRVGNTMADATSQAIDISANGGNWNWGSTFGNLTFSNPYASAAPGFAYSTALKPTEWKSNLTDYGLNVLGNKLADGIQGNNFLSKGTTGGLAGYTMPLLWNIGTNQNNFKP